MKCSFCMINEAKHNPKPNWKVSGKLCSECYDYKYTHDPNSLINKPLFKKILKLSKQKWFIGIITFLLFFSVTMRIIVQN